MKNINCVPKVVGRSIKKLFFKISQYSQENNCVGVSFLIKIQTFRPITLLKEDSNTVVLLKYLAKNFKKSYFEEHLRTTVSELLRKISPLLVLEKVALDGKQHNCATNALH